MMQNVLIPTMSYNVNCNETRKAARRTAEESDSHLFRNLGTRLDSFCSFVGSALAIVVETLNPLAFLKR